MARRTRRTSILIAAGLAFTTWGLTPAEAVPTGPGGVRCTIVGTSGPDRLAGTARRDVICGRGGNDVILGLGGDDLLAGGPGRDRVSGGGGNDVLAGGYRADVLAGGAGNDRLFGGAAGDTLRGEGASDALYGQDGNDDLTGGAGADTLAGGVGTNWCTVDAVDVRSRCVYDRNAPEATGARLSTTAVDVTRGNRSFAMLVHLVDDTGVDRAAVYSSSAGGRGLPVGHARLVSGTVRDGWWRADLYVPRWSGPATYSFDVSAVDRVGRSIHVPLKGVTLTARDSNPDLDNPRVVLLAPSSTAVYDVRASGQDVIVKARITDAVSGVSTVNFCLERPYDGHYSNLPCGLNADLISGTVHDGVWRSVQRIPRGQSGGDWNVSVYASDRAHVGGGGVHWWGPDAYRDWYTPGYESPGHQPLPNGAGRFTVIGSSDSYAPVLTAASVAPQTVDTLGGQATVTLRVRATDAAGEGVREVSAGLAGDETGEGAPNLPSANLALTSGAGTDGEWTGSLTLPQGTPPGTYHLHVEVQDLTHRRGYASPGSPNAGGQLPLPGPVTVVVVDRR